MASCIQTLPCRLGALRRLVTVATSAQTSLARCATSQLDHCTRYTVPVWCAAGVSIQVLKKMSAITIFLEILRYLFLFFLISSALSLLHQFLLKEEYGIVI